MRCVGGCEQRLQLSNRLKGSTPSYDQPLYEVNNKEANIDVAHPQNCPTNCIELAGKNGNSRAL